MEPWQWEAGPQPRGLTRRELPPHLAPHHHYLDSDPAESSLSRPIATVPEDDPDVSEENIFRDMTFEEILEDLNARFLINLPREEMSLVRVYWQAEQAHWFYEDYLRPLNPLLPSYSQRSFTHLIIASSPLYSHLGAKDYDGVWEEYCRYKRMVPCCGGILINKGGDKCLMVRGWKSNAGWSFPRGKINSEESEVDCAIREVEEETGFDLTGLINPNDSVQTQVNAQMVTMFLVKDIDEDTLFETQTRMEIGAIEWVRLNDLPTWTNRRGPKMTTEKGKKKFYNVTPFVGPLKRWLIERGVNPQAKRKKESAASAPPPPSFSNLETPTFSTPHSPTLPRQSSTLEYLFDKFIHKQEADLEASGIEAVDGGDTKAGLERLFGSTKKGIMEEKTTEEKEDDALARLLGSMETVTPTCKPAELAPKQTKLLAVLNPKQSTAPDIGQTSDCLQTNPKASIKPHQASLLAVLSPRPQSASITPAPTSPTMMLARRDVESCSLPISPDPAGTTVDLERIKKQRALLEQITAGFGIPAQVYATPEGAPPPLRPRQQTTLQQIPSQAMQPYPARSAPSFRHQSAAFQTPKLDYETSNPFGSLPTPNIAIPTHFRPMMQPNSRNSELLNAMHRDPARPFHTQQGYRPSGMPPIQPGRSQELVLPSTEAGYGLNGYTGDPRYPLPQALSRNSNLLDMTQPYQSRALPSHPSYPLLQPRQPPPPPQPHQQYPRLSSFRSSSHSYIPPLQQHILPRSIQAVHHPQPRPPNAAMLDFDAGDRGR